MTLVRVWKNLNGSLRVTSFNEKYRHVGESDEDMLNRMGAEAAEKDVSLVGLAHFDIDPVTLPERDQVDAEGDKCSCRNAWRANGGQVVIDDTKIPPNWPGLVKRLRVHLKPRQKLILASELASLRDAMENADKELAREVVRTIVQRQRDEAIFTAPEWATLVATFQAKRIDPTLIES